MEDLLPDFLSETLESLGQLDTQLVKLEREPEDKQTLGAIFRHVHTIKGTCGFLGLSRLEKLAHAAENVLGQHRDGTLPVTTESITLILRTLDGLRVIVDGIQSTGHEPEGDDAGLIEELSLAEGNASTAAVPPALPVAPPPPAATVMASLDAPSPVTLMPPAVPALPTPLPAVAILPPEAAAQTIRVNVEVLEDLMTLVSELVLTRNQILQLARMQDSDVFAGPLQRLSHITSNLQEGVMKTRMQPIGNAWNNLPRLVRDLANDLGKKIELVMVGAETELDRQILELIKDPLTHMIRNSADHGLEGVLDRRGAGKPEQGRIRLNAYHEGGHIVIEVGDDGRGLPVDRIKRKILANGLATEAEMAGMNDQQIQSFIFRAGFSTAAAVTSVSGRGVGMDVVKTNVEQISGTIDVSSEEGKGTLFTVKIPLTLAIVSALIVEVHGDRFAVPQINVVELVHARTAGTRKPLAGQSTSELEIEHINETPVLRLRDHLLPLIDLADLLKLDDVGQPGTTEGVFVVVVQVGASRFGLIVDRVFDTEEIVVKPVAPILRHITLFSGNTILGDGSVIMILDPNGIARATGIGVGHAGTDAPPTTTPPAQNSAQKVALLLFKAGNDHSKAVPLNLVSRLENIERSAIEHPNGEPMTQYRGKLMPLVAMGVPDPRRVPSETQPILVFADGNRVMGLMVDEIVDIMEDRLCVELGTDQPGFLGAATVHGRAVSVLDTAYWLQRAFKDWFSAPISDRPEPRQVLVVEDSPFFRSLIIPALTAQGYHVTAADNPIAALAMRQSGQTFDLILSDIEMPEMDGIEFVREVRMQGAWTKLPVIALTSRISPAAVEHGRQAGFDAYISKFDKAILLDAVGKALSIEREAYVPSREVATEEARP